MASSERFLLFVEGNSPVYLQSVIKIYIGPKTIYTMSEGGGVVFEYVLNPCRRVSSSLVIAVSTLEIEETCVADVAFAVEADCGMEVESTVFVCFLGDGVVGDAPCGTLRP